MTNAVPEIVSSVVVKDNMGDLWVQIPAGIAEASGLTEHSIVGISVEKGVVRVCNVGKVADADAVMADALQYMDRHAETFDRLKDA